MQNKLTVCLITYNHNEYIRKTLDSIFSQKTSFSWNIHIYDDHSTDGTVDTLKDYLHKYPNKIKLVVQSENVGASENWKQLMLSTSAPYIAYVEGDDYWIDDYKLEKQHTLLERDTSIGLVFTQALQVYPGQSESKIIGKALARHGLYLGNPIPSPTVVFRKICLDGFFDELGDQLQSWKMADYALWFWISLKWRLGFIKEPMSAYRILPNSSTRSTLKKHWIYSKLSIRRYFYNKSNCVFAAPTYWLGTAMLYFELAYNHVLILYKRLVRTP
jgi:glycosyltransferase involved in cell wall biosynthesis